VGTELSVEKTICCILYLGYLPKAHMLNAWFSRFHREVVEPLRDGVSSEVFRSLRVFFWWGLWVLAASSLFFASQQWDEQFFFNTLSSHDAEPHHSPRAMGSTDHELEPPKQMFYFHKLIISSMLFLSSMIIPWKICYKSSSQECKDLFPNSWVSLIDIRAFSYARTTLWFM
jgi:hypothetical protein